MRIDLKYIFTGRLNIPKIMKSYPQEAMMPNTSSATKHRRRKRRYCRSHSTRKDREKKLYISFLSNMMDTIYYNFYTQTSLSALIYKTQENG
jgi:hypothetical protein